MVQDWNHRCWIGVLASVVALVLLPGAQAQECYSGSEIDPVTANAVKNAAQRYWDLSSQGDVAALKASAVPEVAGNFGGIEHAVFSYKATFAEAQPSDTRVFVLDASNSKTTWQRADFYCGIYNSPNRTGISIPNLPPGRFALTIAKAAGKDPMTLTLVLQDSGSNSWKLAGYYARANTLNGHDGAWFASKAAEFKAKGQTYNAWFYYLAAWDLQAPVDFISTPALDRLNDELQTVRSGNAPSASAPMDLSSGGKTFKVIELSALPIADELYVRVQYQSAGANAAAQDNPAIMKALLTRFPEFRDAFGGVVARATDSTGHDYVTITAMKDLK
jgi:hypothetical protein